MLHNFSADEAEFLICVGEPSQRKEIFERVKSAGLRMGRFVDPSVKLHEDTVLGEGVISLEAVFWRAIFPLEITAPYHMALFLDMITRSAVIVIWLQLQLLVDLLLLKMAHLAD